jgi:hypothetical protein
MRLAPIVASVLLCACAKSGPEGAAPAPTPSTPGASPSASSATAAPSSPMEAGPAVAAADAGAEGDDAGSGGLGLSGWGGSGGTGGGMPLGLPAVPVGKITDKSVTVTGALSKDVVRRGLAQRRGNLRYCLDKASITDPKVPGGELRLHLEIDASGAVTTAEHEGSTVGNDDARACMLAAARRATFPATDAGTTSVHWVAAMEPTAQGGGAPLGSAPPRGGLL